MKDRLSAIIQHYADGNVKKFTEEIGAPYASIGEAVRGRIKSPTSKTLVRILDRYPQVNGRWLLTGKGEMILSDTVLEQSKHYVLDLTTSRFRSSLSQELRNSSSTRIYNIHPPQSPESFYLKCDVQDLSPMIIPGDLVEFSSVNEINYPNYGSIYIIETHKGESFLRSVMPGENDGQYKLKALNTEYAKEKLIDIDEINAMHLCIAIRRTELRS